MNDALENVAAQFRRLPGIGVKTARRLAYFMLERPESEVADFIQAIETARRKSCYCSVCCNLSVSDPCGICSDDRRDHSVICVVEQPPDVQALEASGEYRGFTTSSTERCLRWTASALTSSASASSSPVWKASK